MSTARTLATTRRVLQQLSHDRRSIALLLLVPAVLLVLFKYVYAVDSRPFDRIGPQLLGIFPFVVMFLITSVTMVRERTSGTLERLLTTRLQRAELVGGYALAFGCVSGPDAGAMGLHYVNMPLVLDGEITASRPEIILYEPVGNGQVRLVGADYLVFADAWDKTHPSAPELMGQKFQQFEAPNRFGLPRFYTLHVWAWKNNPTGTFVNWHSNISCDGFTGQQQ